MSAALTRHLLLQRFPRLQNARASIPFTSSIVVFAPPLLLRVARKARSCQDVSAAKSLFNLRVEFWLRGGRECVVCTGAAALAICSRPGESSPMEAKRHQKDECLQRQPCPHVESLPEWSSPCLWERGRRAARQTDLCSDAQPDDSRALSNPSSRRLSRTAHRPRSSGRSSKGTRANLCPRRIRKTAEELTGGLSSTTGSTATGRRP
jgi:hypothetical protein